MELEELAAKEEPEDLVDREVKEDQDHMADSVVLEDLVAPAAPADQED